MKMGLLSYFMERYEVTVSSKHTIDTIHPMYVIADSASVNGAGEGDVNSGDTS